MSVALNIIIAVSSDNATVAATSKKVISFLIFVSFFSVI